MSPQIRSSVALLRYNGPQSRREFSTLSDHLLKVIALSPREIRVLRNTPRPAIETLAGDTPRPTPISNSSLMHADGRSTTSVSGSSRR